jgi:hypothetical protein
MRWRASRRGAQTFLWEECRAIGCAGCRPRPGRPGGRRRPRYPQRGMASGADHPLPTYSPQLRQRAAAPELSPTTTECSEQHSPAGSQCSLPSPPQPKPTISPNDRLTTSRRRSRLTCQSRRTEMRVARPRHEGTNDPFYAIVTIADRPRRIKTVVIPGRPRCQRRSAPGDAPLRHGSPARPSGSGSMRQPVRAPQDCRSGQALR